LAGAQELGQIGGVEGDEVADLLAAGLGDGHPLARPHRPEAGVAGGNDELSRTPVAHPPLSILARDPAELTQPFRYSMT